MSAKGNSRSRVSLAQSIGRVLREGSRAQIRRYVALLLLRIFSSVLDIIALGVIFYAVTGVIEGKLEPLEFSGFVLFGGSRINEVIAVQLGILILALFLSRSWIAVYTLAKLRDIAVEFEMIMARKILNSSIEGKVGGGNSGRRELPELQHAILANRTWVNGSVFGLSILVADAILSLGLIAAMMVSNFISTFTLVVLIGVAAVIIHNLVSKAVRREAKVQRLGNRTWIEQITGVLSVRSQLVVSGKSSEWTDGIVEQIEKTARSAGQTFILNSIPRYVLEFSVLLATAVIVGASFLFGDFAQSAAGSAVVLAGAFRLAGAVLPLQVAYNSLIHGGEMSNAVVELLDAEQEKDQHPEIEGWVSQLIERIDANSENILITGDSGVGKTTVLNRLIKNAMELGDQNIGYGGQDPAILPGGLDRNVTLSFDESKVPMIDNKLIEILRAGELVDRLSNMQTSFDSIELSGGEITRLELLRAHNGNPSTIFLDEPTTGLDENLADQVARFIMSSGARYIVVSHDKKFIRLLQNSGAEVHHLVEPYLKRKTD